MIYFQGGKMRAILLLTLALCGLSLPVRAQYAAQNDAKYIATLKAVVNYKIDDEENIKSVENLRENQAFNRKLQKMLNKLQNTRTKNSTNRRVYDILLKAGRDVYNELN